MACTHKESCALFPVISLSSALKIWQTFYCDGRHETCERYKLSLAGQPVAASLLPNGKLLDVANDGPRPAAEARPGAPTTRVAPAQSEPTAKPAATTAATGMPQIVSSYYLRIPVKDAPGVLDKVLAPLSELNVPVDATIQKSAVGPNGARCLILVTDQAEEMNVYRAIVRIEALDEVSGSVKSIALERLDTRAASAA
ncbi:hypothetical protein SVA_2220 [Sulfurifustis variabilis]|uniref:ACT domain-containing protein n=1 Tax=Sulfurifustis variabilis TaxID=1675686 RepID=A0A1B4V5F5_9GAMM|nr:hypothetical protein [Sulfurifustis variabilis]BAU48770.1 hypothetical protein SVA_2220 [Sulfurifustis variabilis]